MKISLLAAALCALTLGPVLADDFADRLDIGEGAIRKQQADYQAAKAAGQKSQAVIDRTLEAMNDGNEVGTAVAEYVKDNKVVIQLDAALPDSPRVLAPLITNQVSSRMVGVIMPPCSEKEYVRLSIEVRAWIELGGDKKTLPVIEPITGYKDQAMSDRFKIWLDNGSEMALYRIGQAAKTESVMELMDKEKDPAQKEKLETANKLFVVFLMTENEWKRSNAFRLK